MGANFSEEGGVGGGLGQSRPSPTAQTEMTRGPSQEIITSFFGILRVGNTREKIIAR